MNYSTPNKSERFVFQIVAALFERQFINLRSREINLWIVLQNFSINHLS